MKVSNLACLEITEYYYPAYEKYFYPFNKNFNLELS